MSNTSNRRFTPRPAVRKGQKARVGLAGPSGSGKTWTALETATTLAAGEPVLVLDTERGSASLYADYFTFEVIEWEPPYDPRELAEVIAEQAPNYGAIVPDSLSHFWEAEGGTRDIVDAAAARARGNSFAGWKEGTPAQNDMIAALLQAPCHIVATMRSKTEYVLEERNGKQVPRKIGMAPIQRAGIEYEFTVTADLDYEHTLLIDKTRCHPLAGRMFKMGHTVEMGEVLRDWLGSAEALAVAGTAEEIVGLLNQIHDATERATAKKMFVDLFGQPQNLTLNQATEGKAWIADRVAALVDMDTNRGAGVDGPDRGGDAGHTPDGEGREALTSDTVAPGDGGNGQDVARTGPEPAPHAQGEGAAAAPVAAAPEPDQPIDARRLGIRAPKVFEQVIESYPERRKTWLNDSLRHSLAYVVSKGEATSANDLDPEQLLTVWRLLDAVEARTVTFTWSALPTKGVEWTWADGTTSTVLWTELTLAEAGAA